MADSLRKWGHQQEAVSTLTDAEHLMVSQPVLLGEHPLYAVVHEAFGWAAFDTWQLAEATKHFSEAKGIRLQHRKAGNPRSWRSLLWIEQGEAMTAHFQGNQDGAQKQYRSLLEQIDSSLKGGLIRELPKQQRTELAARRPNLYERLGDCYLFGAGIDHVEACNALDQAIQATEDSSFDSERLWPHILALKFKYAMALSLGGERSESEYVFQAAETEFKERQQAEKVSDGQRKIYEPIRMVAQSIIHLDVGSEEDRRAAVKALEEYYSTMSARVSRRNIDLVMLVSEELLKPTVLKPEDAQKIVRRLNSIIDTLRSADDERLTSIYLQRYCESAQRALQNVPAASVSSTVDDTARKLTAVLSESAEQTTQTARGMTRGTIQYDDNGKPVSCRLHVLAIGVSRYEHHKELELAYADADADALFEAYGMLCKDGDDSSESALFQRGTFRKLTNESANKAAIIEAIDQMALAATKHDLVVVSLSGHGTVDEDGNFFFLPYDYRDSSLRASAIWDEELRAMLTRRKSNAILVLDACHSGAATEVGARSGSTQEMRNALHRFSTANKGLCILAASLGSKKAYEDPQLGHGVLTLALLEALRGKYDEHAVAKMKEQNKESATRLPGAQGIGSLITLEDIQYYVCSRVEELSDGKQRATKNRLGGDLSLRDIPIRFTSVDTQP